MSATNRMYRSDAEAMAVALHEMREATEQALIALQQRNPEAAVAALDRGEQASRALANIQLRWETVPPTVAEEARAVQALQAIALQQAEAGAAQCRIDLARLTEGGKSLRTYRPAAFAAGPILDCHS
ncbi:MAG: hypothetical protein JNJ88_10740 [Planctomycetes bacterium]|nr:hypothetical protein [Planctomycetota bacterium]